MFSTARVCSANRRIAVRCASVTTNIQHCQELVRKHDYHGYLCTLFLPKDLRPDAFALRAFNVELALVRESVKEDRIGMIRLQFWKEMLQQGENPPMHPVSICVHQTMARRRLSKSFLTRLVQARQSNLSDTAFATLQELETFSEHTHATLLYLLLEAANLRDINADHAASHVGKALGLTALLRATPLLARRGKVRLPLDLLAKYQISQHAVLGGPPTPPSSASGPAASPAHREPKAAAVPAALRELVYEIASAAHVHLETAKQCKLPPIALRVLLSAAPCKLYLDKLQKADFDVYSPVLQQGGLPVPLCILSAAVRRSLC